MTRNAGDYVKSWGAALIRGAASNPEFTVVSSFLKEEEASWHLVTSQPPGYWYLHCLQAVCLVQVTLPSVNDHIDNLLEP